PQPASASRVGAGPRPATFIRPLQSQEAEEGGSVTLRCELSKAGVPVKWKKGSEVLKAGEKYQVKQEASVSELLIDKVQPGDSGDYSCVCGEQKTTASVSIKGRSRTSDESHLTKAFFNVSTVHKLFIHEHPNTFVLASTCCCRVQSGSVCLLCFVFVFIGGLLSVNPISKISLSG
uniref:Ig-like domain-containing protein n=1 Tax=Salarias fasciatus TaxID=181472 RepID=A0A672FRW9_SALFA